MGRTAAIGIQSFETIIEGNYFYVDKTSFIKEWWESGDSVTLITRPRRFGKTLNMSMLEQFFSVNYADKKALFEGLSIWEEEKYRMLQGTYPVISLSFANIKENTYENAKQKMYQILVDMYENHRFLLEEGYLEGTEIDFFRSVNMDMKETTATQAIHKLCKFLARYYNKNVIVLVDEYDTPMQEAYVNGYWNELVSFTRSMFNAAFKTNPYLERAIMTGITRVSKESVFSDLNHLEVVTTTSDKYADSFGFTQEEVVAALEECGLEEEKEKVKYWYDGFIFGKHSDIYNPWSVLNFLSKGSYNTYWANTSSNSLVGKLIREGNKNVKKDFELLLKGYSIFCPVDEQIVYNQLEDNEEAIWSLLLASGYLKVLKCDNLNELEASEEALYELALTNNEVLRMFYGMVKGWFQGSKIYYNDFLRAMLSGDKKAMNVYMNKVSLEVFSYFDTGNRPSGTEPERFYHGFVLGLIAELQGRYIITSNRESGFGRYDVMIEPKEQGKEAFILEFKVHDPDEEAALQDTVDAALRQIEEKQYTAALIARGIPQKLIRKYGFAFEGKKVLIG